MLAIMHDASNHARCQRPRTMQAITHDASDHAWYQRPRKMPASTHDANDHARSLHPAPCPHTSRRYAELCFPILQDSAADDVGIEIIVRRHRVRNQRWRDSKENETFRDYNDDIARNVYINVSCLSERRV